MLELNKIGRFAELKIEEEQYPEHGAVIDGVSEATGIYDTFYDLGAVSNSQSTAETSFILDGVTEAADQNAAKIPERTVGSDNEEKQCNNPMKDSSEIEITEEKFEEDKTHGPDI